MKTNPLLREKWRVQRDLARAVGPDVTRYLDLIDETAREWAQKNDVKLRYADVSELPLAKLCLRESGPTYETQHNKRKRRTTIP